MALAVPAIAWLKQSVLFLLLATVVLVAIALAAWWVYAGNRPLPRDLMVTHKSALDTAT